jgi:hypothetical protein
MLRITIVTSIALSLGCTLTPGHGMGGAFGEGGAGDTGEGGDANADAGADEGDGGEESSGGAADTNEPADDSSSGAGTFDPMDGSSSSGAVDDGGSGEEESTGAPADGGDVEPGGPYAGCSTSDDCDPNVPGLACIHADQNGADGFCSPACGTYGATPPDANLCPDPPEGVTAIKVCVEGLVRNCALSCTADGDCPTGTACLPANNGHGPYCFGV